jgi:hypothetical protein
VDPRGAGEIAPARGAVTALPRAEQRCRALLDARRLTEQELEALRERVDAAQLPECSALVLFGSWGRHELTPGSDSDWGLILGIGAPPETDRSVQRAVAHLDRAFADRAAPGRQGYFGCAFAAVSLADRIGLDEDDTRNLTRRMLLMLESVAVHGDDVRVQARDTVLDRYLEYHHRDFRPPRFLINDLIRYWRTICVDFEGKVAQDRREGAARDKFAMRRAKLRTSRKLLYASGLLPALLCAFVEAGAIPSFLRTQLDAVATDRVTRAFVHLGQTDAAVRAMAAYSDWLALLADDERRAALEGISSGTRRHASPEYRDAERIGAVLDNGLASVLFDTALASTARTYAVL